MAACVRGVSLCRLIALVLVAILALCVLFALPGCKESQTIKNVIYDQNATQVDQDSGKTTKVVSENGKATSKDTDLYKEAKSGDKHLKANLNYTSKEADSTLPVPKFIYDAVSTNNSEASTKVKNSEQNTNTDDEDDGDDADENEGDNTADSPKSKESGKKKGDKSNKGSGSKGKSKGRGTNGISGNENGNDDEEDADARVYDTTGDNPEIPDASSIAAYGQLGVIVQMLSGEDTDGGTTRLKATDRSLGKSAFMQVFADEGVSGINIRGWTLRDGVYKPDVDEIIKAKPDTVLVTSTGEFTKKQKNKLAKNDISLTVVPGLTSATRICSTVDIVGKMLSAVTAGESSERAEEYVQYHDELVKEIEGSRGYARYKSVLDADMTKKPTTYSARYFTLLIDNWDYKASFSFRNAITASGTGVGLATVGYRWSPVSYYLGVGGVVNNAAAIDEAKNVDGLLAPAWQYNTRVLDPNEVGYSSDFAGNTYDSWPNGFSKTTLTKADSSKNTSSENGFGTDVFPRVIVADKKMKRTFQKSAASSTGLYHPFGEVATSTGTIHGTVVGNTNVMTTIASDMDPEKCVLVNPHGLFTSWIEGSVESVLESAWIASVSAYDSGWNGSVSDEISEFYRKFYRCTLSSDEVAEIEGGIDDIYAGED